MEYGILKDNLIVERVFDISYLHKITFSIDSRITIYIQSCTDIVGFKIF
jgi:hypothetical protein